MVRIFLAFLLLLLVPRAALAQVMLAQQGGAQTCAAPCARTAVIFIHGLTGSAATWVNDETGASFPDLLLKDDDPELSGKLDVYTVEYASLWNAGKSVVEVTKAVSYELDRLIFTKQYRKVILIAHSLGGNIAREYLVHVTASYGHAALGRIPMLITLGTPVEGAKLANYASLFSSNEQVRSLIEIHKNDFLQLLGQTSSDVLTKRLNNHCSLIEFDAGYETKGVTGLIIVSKESATAQATRTAGEDWGKNHLQLPKPADRTDKVYAWVQSELKLCAVGQERCKAASNPSATCAAGDFFAPALP